MEESACIGGCSWCVLRVCGFVRQGGGSRRCVGWHAIRPPLPLPLVVTLPLEKTTPPSPSPGLLVCLALCLIMQSGPLSPCHRSSPNPLTRPPSLPHLACLSASSSASSCQPMAAATSSFSSCSASRASSISAFSSRRRALDA